jgi:urease accessory protein
VTAAGAAPSLPSLPAAAAVAASMRLLQFGDSMLPVGSFAFSAALESAVQRGVVCDIQTLDEYVATATRQAAGCDGIGLLHAHRAAAAGDLAGVLRADRAVFERKLDAEARTMVVRMGRKLAEVGERVVGGAIGGGWLTAIREATTAGTFPVALGVIFADLGSPETDAFAVHQYGVAFQILSAALRLMRIDHLDTQAILFRANAGAGPAYAAVVDATLGDMATFAPMTDILAAVHARAHVRLFMS